MTSSKTIRALIVDDEPLARRRIRRMLAHDPEVAIVGDCSNGRDAIAAIKSESPDLIFLDVQMPEVDGFDVLASTEAKRPPLVIFVTAYDQYALRAFEVAAVDYLVKPFDRRRFEGALDRAKSRLASGRDRVLVWALALHILARVRSGVPAHRAGRAQLPVRLHRVSEGHACYETVL